MKKVDIIIPAYNPGPYLRDSIESALSQSYKNTGIIVIDDCSQPTIRPMVESYPEVRYMRTEKNSGPSGARNLGITNSSADFISFLDADDIMDREKISLSINEFSKNKDIGMTCGNYKRIFNRNKISDPFYKRSININYKNMIRQNFVASGSVTVKRAVFDDVGLFDEKYRISEDYDMWLRIVEKYPIKYIHKVLYYYSVIHNSGSLTNSENSQKIGINNNRVIRSNSLKRVRKQS